MTIPKLNLDPRNTKQLLEQMAQRTQAASGNKITDFSPGSPVQAIFEGQAYAVAELLYFLNRLPEATALEVLRLAGVSRSPGTKARGYLEFVLSTALASAYFLPTGFTIPDPNTGNLSWVLTQDLFIPAGQTIGRVNVEASLPGKAYNRRNWQLNITDTALSYVSLIRNPEPLAGGTDLEPMPDLLNRAQLAMRYRGTLVTAADYENRSQEYLGPGSRAWAIPSLMANKTTEAPGHVHLFLVGADGQPPTPSVCQEIQGKLREDSYPAASVWVSPVDTLPVSLDVTLSAESVSNDRLNSFWEVASVYLGPLSYRIGAPILVKELEFLFRKQPGITGVTSVLINGSSVSQALPTKYTLPYLSTLKLTQIDPSGKAITGTRTVGYDGDPD